MFVTRKHLPRRTVLRGLGAALGSWASGALYEQTGSYLASFALAIAAALSGLGMFWAVRDGA